MAMLLPALSCLAAGQAVAGDAPPTPSAGWQFERDVAWPTYALLEPTITDLNIDVMVLLCEQTERQVGLQLRLYPSEPGPLRSSRSAPVDLDPDIVIEIDGRRHDAQILFADDFMVVADAADGPVPILSASLIAALQIGRHFAMTFRPVEVPRSSTSTPALQVTADLQAGIGGAAIAAVRRCGVPNDTLAAGTNRER
ncbi:hypothetical protein [Reyranella sp.]|uniref:hypothetical protein n=1 Tax=Reyranella sp. TaxID=1929291 RepID=UPI003D0B3F21